MTRGIIRQQVLRLEALQVAMRESLTRAQLGNSTRTQVLDEFDNYTFRVNKIEKALAAHPEANENPD